MVVSGVAPGALAGSAPYIRRASAVSSPSVASATTTLPAGAAAGRLLRSGLEGVDGNRTAHLATDVAPRPGLRWRGFAKGRQGQRARLVGVWDDLQHTFGISGAAQPVDERFQAGRPGELHRREAERLILARLEHGGTGWIRCDGQRD